MKKILILGAGQSTPSLISYLLNEAKENNWFVTVCDMNLELAKQRVNGHPNGIALEFDVNDAAMRNKLIEESDIVVNLLAPVFQYLIALDCLNFGKHCVTASYENLRVAELHKDAVRKGILILNEMGLDPGIDHMSAMALINKIREKGGYVKSFISYGGGLPAPEVKSNPFNYCITWNPRNVVMAGESGALYKEQGKQKVISYQQVFNRTWEVDIEGVGTFEAYPNRDSLIYEKIFNVKKTETMVRATLRYPGWGETWAQIVKLGLPTENFKIPNLHQKTYAEYIDMFLPLNISGTKIETKTANYLGISPTGKIMNNLRWLGLFSDEKIGGKVSTSAEVMTDLLRKKLPLPSGGRDLVILAHEVIAKYPKEKREEKIVSTLVEYGDPHGDTAIAKTVGLPAAIAAKLILQNKLPLNGCYIPTHPSVYVPVMAELKKLGLKFKEKVQKIK
ncbi:MAG: saccharopine dehydrogenase NADP-binding domain-containing protein [Melioribacteraceae bacterium]|jgi:saccharopine dehydrogenase-like NADP-dependent oxidoreductase|nr:saccharopine dehydrogenase NADP-binding domain-containing protein [Melioribacteraceae bacterium]